jgi:VIT1/CCC1 family predicted Fe2+/Mn2+ transporter
MDTPFHNNFSNSHLKNSDLIRDVAIGMSDGLTIPFALAAGLSGAFDKSSSIIIAGIVAVAVGSIAMGLGGYLAGKAEQVHYKNETTGEYDEVESPANKENEATMDFFANLDLSRELQEQAVQESEKDKERWAAFMKKYELGLDKPEPKQAAKTALIIWLSYIAGGIIPLSPYFFIAHSTEALEISVVATLVCLFVFGFFKSKMTGVKPIWGALKVTLIGAAAAAAAFGVAKLFVAH